MKPENIETQRLRVFLEGLEMEQIEELLESTPEDLRDVAVMMKEMIQTLT